MVNGLDGAANTGAGVFMSWVMTPTGAMLTLFLIGVGVAVAVRRGVRWLTVLFRVVLGMWALWVLGGILEAWGVPVRETVRTVGGLLPGLARSVIVWLEAMFRLAG